MRDGGGVPPSLSPRHKSGQPHRSLTGAIERQGGTVGRTARESDLCPLLGQPDRVTAFRALGLQHSGGLLLRPVVRPQDDRLVAGLGVGTRLAAGNFIPVNQAFDRLE